MSVLVILYVQKTHTPVFFSTPILGSLCPYSKKKPCVYPENELLNYWFLSALLCRKV